MNSNFRPLGYTESIQYSLETLGILRNVVLIIELTKATSIKSTIQLLKTAQEKFTALQLCIQDVNGIPNFLAKVNFDAIPLNIIQKATDSEKILPETIELRMNNPIKLNKFLWQIDIITQPHHKHLLLTFHHTIFDGGSIHKLLNLFSSTKKDSNQPSKNNVYPPIEMGFKSNSKIEAGQQKRAQTHRWPTYKTEVIKSQISKCTTIDCDHLSVNTLKKLCRRHKLTLNQLINGVAIKSILKQNIPKKEVAIHTPIDLRKKSLIEDHRHEIGCFIDIAHSHFSNLGNKNVIAISQLYANATEAKIENPVPNSHFSFSEIRDNHTSYFKKKTACFSGGIAVSNIGEVIEKPEFIKDLHFSTSLSGGLGIFVISLLTLNDKLRITISYTTPLISPELITSFIETFKQECKELCRTDFLKVDL